MSRWLSILLSVLLLSFALRAEADTYKVKASTGQQDQVTQLVVSTIGTKPLPKADFEKKVAELFDKSITFSLTNGQSTALKRDTRVAATSTKLSMRAVLDATKFMASSATAKDGLYQITPAPKLTWMEYLEDCPCIYIDYTPAK